MARVLMSERLSRLRTEYENVLSDARAELEAAERHAAAKRADLVEIEVSLARLTGRASQARRPRHILPTEESGPSPPARDGVERPERH